MVAALHRAGYERLRVFPFLDDGPAPRWKCYVVPIGFVSRDHGAVLVPNYPRSLDRPQHGPAPMPFHLIALGAADYPWPGFATQTPDEAAGTFVSRYPDLAEQGRGPDPAYAAWFADVLARTAPDGLVYAHAPGTACPEPAGDLGTLNMRGTVVIPAPPPGEA
jgi:hypothetical protein